MVEREYYLGIRKLWLEGEEEAEDRSRVVGEEGFRELESLILQ